MIVGTVPIRRQISRVAAVLLVGALALGCSAQGPAPEPTANRSPAATPTASAPAPPSAAQRSTPTPRTRQPAPAREPAPPVRSAARQAELNRRLIEAAWKDDRATAAKLIRAGADVNAKDETEQSAYLIATSEGYLELLELTLRSGADVRSLDSYQGTGLIRAADRGHADVVGRLLRTGIKVNHVNNLGWTALHEAILLGNGSQRYVDTVRLLIAGGADPRLRSQRDGVTPLNHARRKGYDTIAATVQRAISARPVANPDRQLLRAAANGDADQVALALRAGARLEARDGQDRTALLLAASGNRPAVARLLVQLGADPDALDGRHDTPWLVTGVTGSVPMVEILLPARPDLTIRNRFGGTSLIPASERGHVDYVRRVLQTDIDVNHVNDLGWTALLEAVILGDGSKRYAEIVRLLLDAGADASIPDSNGVTALAHARARNHADIAAILRRAR